MKYSFYLLLLLGVFGCTSNSPTNESPPTVEEKKELSAYKHRMARFSNSVSNPFNWGASPKTMRKWGKARGWEVQTPLEDSEEKPGMKQMTYWVDKGEGEYKQMITLLFQGDKLVSVSLVAMGKMDLAIKTMLSEECESSPEEVDIWRCSKSKTASRRQTVDTHAGAMYTFVDAHTLFQE